MNAILASAPPSDPPPMFSGSALLVPGLAVAAALAASGHAVLYKRDSRSTALWVGLIWLLPLLGPLFYFGFGINRIQRRAALLRRDRGRYRAPTDLNQAGCPASACGHFAPLADLVGKVTSRPLLPGNHLELMIPAEATYATMLAAIDGARHSVALSTYIFERDDVGARFAASLGAAVRRGVSVRVLIDATGTLFSWRPVLGELRRQGVPSARFLPAFSIGHPISVNLRNHRKLLIVDGTTGFTGGMNICSPHLRTGHPPPPMEDAHFRVRGPVVAQLQEAFADDWFFTTGEALAGEAQGAGLADAARGAGD